MTIAGSLMVYGTKVMQDWGKILLGLAIGTQAFDTLQLKYRSKRLAAEKKRLDTPEELDINMLRPPKLRLQSPVNEPSVSLVHSLPSVSLASDHQIDVTNDDLKQEYSVSGEDPVARVMREMVEERITEPLKQAEKVRETLSNVVERDENADEFLRRAEYYLETHSKIKEINSVLEPKNEKRSINDLKLFFVNPVNKEKYKVQAGDFLKNELSFVEAEKAFKTLYVKYLPKESDVSRQTESISEGVSAVVIHPSPGSTPSPESPIARSRSAMEMARIDTDSRTPSSKGSTNSGSGKSRL